MGIRYIIVDSDQSFAMTLRQQLGLFNQFDYQGWYPGVNGLVHVIEEKRIEAVFCNRNLPSPSPEGFTFVVCEHMKELMVVLYSDNPNDAYSALENRAFDFMALPLTPASLSRVAGRIQEYHSLISLRRKNREKSLMIRTKEGFRLARLVDILFVERINRRTQVVMTNGSTIELTGYSIGELEKLLAGNGFYRSYKSILVNMAHVVFVRSNNETKTYSLQMRDYNMELPLSRERYTEVLQLLKQEFTKISL